jgi:ATP-binding cassette subfamily C (CFTR/MRP) protein 1
MPFFNYKLTSTRNDRELKTLKEQGLSLAMANFVWSTGPFLVSFISFATSAITQTSGTSMKAESVFPALALLALLHNPLAAFPYVISAIGDGKIAIGRIEKFLSANEVQDNTPDRQVADNQTYLDNNDAITVKDAIFSWSYNPEKPSLIVPSLAFQRGGFYCITGTVGSGKSTLLQAFLGEVPKPRGTFKVQGSIAYVSQTPWIITGSIKENILFGHVLQPEVYDTVVAACGLNEDFATLMDGDETKVGGQGMNLSGGQKARVALARAIYARREIYMMDDVLSAVDQGVRRHLIENVLGPNGLLRSKTRILVTHSEEVLSLVDDIVTVKDGKAVQSGQQREIEERNEDSENLESERNGGNSTTQPLRTKDPAELAIPQPRQKGRILQRNEQKAKSPASSAPSTRGKRSSWHLCKTYFYASTPPAILLYLAILVLARLMIISSDIWIKIWIEDTKNEDNKYNVWVYVGIYFVLGIGAAILAACQLAVLLIGASLRVSRRSYLSELDLLN